MPMMLVSDVAGVTLQTAMARRGKPLDMSKIPSRN